MKSVILQKGFSIGIIVLLVGINITSFASSLLDTPSEITNESHDDIPILDNGKAVGGTFAQYVAGRDNSPFVIHCLRQSKSGGRSTAPFLVVFVNAALAPQIEEELNTYLTNLNEKGYQTVLLAVSGGTPEDLKTILLSYWTNPEYNLTGAVFIGDIAVAWYHHENDYGEEPAEFPCDLFLMDLDGQWQFNESIGMYDGHSNGDGDTAPEIYLGRIDASKVAGNEVDIIKAYFQKVQDFWMGNMVYTHKGLTYTDHDWAGFNDFRHDIHYWLPDYTALWWPNVNREDYLYNQLPNTTYEFIQIACHAGETSYSHHFNIGGYLYSDDVRAAPPMAIFYNIFTCGSLRFTDFNCLGNAYVMNTTSPSLVCVGSTKTGSMLDFRYFYEPIGQGDTFGQAFQKWFTYEAPYSENDISWFYGMEILGDPTLLPTLELNKPQWQNQGQNRSTIQRGEPLLLYAQGKDNSALHYATLATNETGVWENITGAYGSPLDLGGVKAQWTWSNFTWQNWAVPQGRSVGWKIYYNDLSGNWNCTDVMSFFVLPNPIIHDYTGTVTTTGGSFTFNTSVYDDDGVAAAYIEYWYGNGDHSNVSMVLTNGFYLRTITVSQTETTLHYIIHAKDNADYWSSTSEKIVPITDTINPVWLSQGQSTPTVPPGGSVVLSAQGFDNIGLVKAWVATNETGSWLNFSGEGWWDGDWNYSKKIMVDHTKVPGNLSNFIILVHYTSTDFIEHAQPDGDDFVFTSADNATQYAHEIESYNSATGELMAWVKIPAVFSNQDTIFYIYYGNSSCDSQQNSEGTWSNGYLMVHHLTGTSYIDLKDSTSNHWDMTSDGGSPSYNQPGMVGTCVDFDGSNDFLKTNGFILAYDSSYTGSVWLYVDGNAGTQRYVFESISDQSVSLLLWTNEKYKARTHMTPNGWPVVYSTTLATPSNPHWHYLSTRVNTTSDKIEILVNGVREGFTTITGTVNPATGLNIGESSTNNNFMNGKIDEIRFSNVPRSDAWIRTEYNNMISPATFVSVGSEQMSHTGWAYGSPMDLQSGSNERVWSNFTWQNSNIPAGRIVGWKITYVDAQRNIVQTNVMSFRVGEQNTPPNKPYKPQGKITGIVNRPYNYTTTTIDPDGDYIFYQWNWGDGNISGWMGPYKSEEKILTPHTWTRRGLYHVKVKAKDIHDAESDWSDPLPVRIRSPWDTSITNHD